MVDGRLAVAVYFDSSTLIVCRRTDRYHILGDIDAQFQAFSIDCREAVDEFVFVNATGIEIKMVDRIVNT